MFDMLTLVSLGIIVGLMAIIVVDVSVDCGIGVWAEMFHDAKEDIKLATRPKGSHYK